MSAKNRTVTGVVALATGFLVAGRAMAGILDPTNENVTSLGNTGTMSTNAGLAYAAGVPKAGRLTGNNETFQKGLTAPSLRFTVGTGIASNCVTDIQTGLMWLKNPDAIPRIWTNASTYCEGLDGAGGRGGCSDWRLPHFKELQSLMVSGQQNPALPPGHPFTGVQLGYYWANPTFENYSHVAWLVDLRQGYLRYGYKPATHFVWPVRGGK